MNSPHVGDLCNMIRRLSDSGYRLVVVSQQDGVVAYALPASGSGPLYVARCADGSGPEAVAQSVAALADAVDEGAPLRHAAA